MSLTSLAPRLSLAALLLGTALPAFAQDAPSAASAKAIAMQKDMITLDSHLDTPASLARPEWSIMDEHKGDYTQVDYPRMVEGALDGGWWVIYTPQGKIGPSEFAEVRDFALLRGMAVRTMVAANPDQFELATKASDAARIKAAGKRVVFMSIENAYPLGYDLSLLQTFYDMGVRMLGFAHFRNNQFADSSTDPKGPEWNGLSPLGEELLVKANKMGMIIDASHSSDDVLDQLLEKSTTPVILSHSGAKAIFDHPRNVDDERLKAVAAKGGVIQVNSYEGYLREMEASSPERQKAMGEFYQKMDAEGPLDKATYDALMAERRELDKKYPPADHASFADFLKHLFHILDVVGPDHVGIGMDWDGGGGTESMEDVSDLPLITQALIDKGYSKADIAKIWGGNILRVMAEVEAKAEKPE